MTNPPHFKGFRPIGVQEETNPVILIYEEYEAIRLSDFELYNQVEASKQMDISRPTYARIYESARKKIAQAFIMGRAIVFEGGKVYFNSDWYSCNNCGCWFNNPEKEQEVRSCALCASADIEQYIDNSEKATTEDICICPKCGYKVQNTPGIPCKKDYCPECNCLMMRKGVPHC